MSRAEIKQWAKSKIKGHIWELLIPIAVTGILTSLTIGQHVTTSTDGGAAVQVSGGFNLGFFFYFVTVGLTYFMVRFINDESHEFKDIFRFAGDYVRIFLVNLLQIIFIVLWTLLLIVPGIIKGIAYALVPYLLADDKYKDLSYTAVLKKSEEMMKGHKMDYFVFVLSFFGWFLLSALTFFILMIWLAPYFETAKTKFLNDIKTSAEGGSTGTVASDNAQETTAEANVETEKKKCPNCGTEVDANTKFCTNCGKEI